jgi:TorA maturation chaperone TorD
MTGHPLNATAAQLHFPDDAQTSVQSTIAPEDAARAGVYALLGALLRGVPNAALLEHVRSLPPAEGRGEFALAWEGMRLAAEQLRLEEVDDEYHQLFIGLGRGELVPYGSWYQTGFLMEKPLGVLRDDLRALGFERGADVHEPEDHIAALCEVMAALAQDAEVPAVLSLTRQRAFFQTHMAEWIGRFWRDLENAESALFYRSVARLGSAFTALEARYLEPGA